MNKELEKNISLSFQELEKSNSLSFLIQNSTIKSVDISQKCEKNVGESSLISNTEKTATIQDFSMLISNQYNVKPK